MKAFKDYLLITLGCLITSISLNGLLIPNRIAAGGVSGFATVLYYLFGIPVSITLIVVNIPLFIAGVIYLGRKFGIRTLYGTIILALMVALTSGISPLTSDPLLASIYGGVLSGLGLGIVFRAKATTGGTDLAAQLLHKFWGFTVGQGLLGIDFLVIALATIAFNAELAMYALIAVFITGKGIDLVQQGLRVSKMALIISNEPEKISETILYKLNRGATTLRGKGAYSKVDKDVILCVVNQMEITKLKEMVYDVDNKAFVIVTDITEALGEGFKLIDN
ncbi:YitT family protein [Alkalicella caledoniensis]|uniref:YitT family protein n=1 Tax=Alkalicella caledoniensis TaxID=2731377 RepID=A0A7G9W6Z0_ALKCA|nr:YitT family protein [Alkalicella caledoniensis]QNO14452.1 YitT family protein [Alkalicella caledoniensis]